MTRAAARTIVRPNVAVVVVILRARSRGVAAAVAAVRFFWRCLLLSGVLDGGTGWMWVKPSFGPSVLFFPCPAAREDAVRLLGFFCSERRSWSREYGEVRVRLASTLLTSSTKFRRKFEFCEHARI